MQSNLYITLHLYANSLVAKSDSCLSNNLLQMHCFDLNLKNNLFYTQK